MSKTYIVSRNGGTVTKAPINDNKIPIYANETALDADLSNLPDGTICATSGGHDDVIDQMKAYIRDQNELSNYESISWTNSAAGAFEMQYDGIFCSANGAAQGVNFMVSSDGGTSWKRVAGCGGGGEPGQRLAAGAQILLMKGWKVYLVLAPSADSGGLTNSGSVAYFKKRDYSNRQ